MKTTSLFFAALICSSASASVNTLLPQPKSLVTGEKLVAVANLQPSVVMVDSIAGAYDYPLHGYPNEAYTLTIDGNGARIEAVSAVGELRARQTLEQLCEGVDSLPHLAIVDWPAFKLRGYMHDVGRSYIPIEHLIRQIELLVKFKVNTFHWHLTENQAWRLQIKSHPELTSDSSMVRHHGGYYTHDDVKALLDVARRNGVLVIPEIDMPGHSAAFQRATGHDMQSAEGMAILRDALREVADLFDVEPYIHMGADEKDITNPEFLPSMIDYIHTLGKKVICWNPIFGMSVKDLKGLDVTQMWSTAGKAIEGMPNIDSRYHYTNHMDVFADFVGLYKSNVYYRQRGDEDVVGCITATWNDRLLPSDDDIMAQNNFYGHVLAACTRAWLGGQDEYIEQVGTSLPKEGAFYDDFVDFERRFLHHKSTTLRDEKIPYVRQSNIIWDVTLSDGRQYEAAGAAVYLRHTWGDAIPGLVEKADKGLVATARTWIYSPDDREVGALIETQNYSRSDFDVAPPADAWDLKGSRIYLNDTELLPQPWTNTDVKPSAEVLLGNENFTARKPYPIKLRKGWNSVKLHLPYVDTPGVRLNKWLFTFVVTDPDGTEAPTNLIYSSQPK